MIFSCNFVCASIWLLKKKGFYIKEVCVWKLFRQKEDGCPTRTTAKVLGYYLTNSGDHRVTAENSAYVWMRACVCRPMFVCLCADEHTCTSFYFTWPWCVMYDNYCELKSRRSCHRIDSFLSYSSSRTLPYNKQAHMNLSLFIFHCRHVLNGLKVFRVYQKRNCPIRLSLGSKYQIIIKVYNP